MLYIKIDRMSIDITEEDIQCFESILWSALNGIKESIKTHYCSKHHDSYGRGLPHAEGLFLEQKGAEVAMIQSIFQRLGRTGIKEELLRYLREEYEKQHGKQK